MAAEKGSARRVDMKSPSNEGEMGRLRRDIYRSDMEKLRLFTQMLRANALFKRATITHK